MKTRNIIGFEKVLLNQWIKVRTLAYLLGRLLKGEVPPGKFIRVLRRLLYFLSRMKHNKYVKYGNRVKINLYVPAFPSRAFFTACNKVFEFDEKMPDESVLISVTKACRYKCPHCYQKHDMGKDVDIDSLIKTVKILQDKGVAFFNIEGGEPFLSFDRLLKVCETIDSRSEILINSTGSGITGEKLMAIKRPNLLGIMFSLHTYNEGEMNGFMGVDNAWENLEKGISLCHETGINVSFNTCLQRSAFYDDTFERVIDRASSFGGIILQLIKPKPSGGWLEGGATVFSEDDLQFICEKVHAYNQKPGYRDKIFISPMIYEESAEMFGCTAGGTDRFYINAKGDLQPCEFLNISFGNIAIDDFETIYGRMRQVFREPGSEWLCEKYSPAIRSIMSSNNLKSLPLPPELSEEVYKNWERGKKPDFYKKLEAL